MKQYTWSCHCSAVTYEVGLDLTQPVFECNCSHCQMKGFLLSFAPKSDFKLLSGEKNLSEYRFHKKVISHLFCNICGVQCFWYGEKDGIPTVSINIRTLKDINLLELKKIPVDGKRF